MSTSFYALHESTNIIVAEHLTPNLAARALDTDQQVLLTDLPDLQALAKARNKLLYVPLLHGEDAAMGTLAGVA